MGLDYVPGPNEDPVLAQLRDPVQTGGQGAPEPAAGVGSWWGIQRKMEGGGGSSGLQKLPTWNFQKPGAQEPCINACSAGF